MSVRLCVCLRVLLLYIVGAMCAVGATVIVKTITTRTVAEAAAAGLSVPAEAAKEINCALNNNNIPFRSLTAH